MTKEQLGKQIEALRKKLRVSTYSLEQKGIHPGLPSRIEKGQKGYSIDSLIKYLSAINEVHFERGGKEKELVLQVLCDVSLDSSFSNDTTPMGQKVSE